MVYLVGIVLTLTCYLEIDALQRIRAIMKGVPNYFTWWSFDIILVIAVTSIIFLALQFLANARRLKIAYLILGTYFMIALMLQVCAAGNVFRIYTNLDN